jgi:hypothetical protein
VGERAWAAPLDDCTDVLDVKANQEHVTVLDLIVLPFQAEFAQFSALGERTTGYQIFVIVQFGCYKVSSHF